MIMNKIVINLPERPISLKRHRHTRSGHVYNPSLKDQKDFLLRSLKFSPPSPMVNSVGLYCWFTFERPKNHYRTGKFSDQLKPNVPTWHTIKPDISNLIKFYEDALGLSDKFFNDDKQIAFVNGVKIYDRKPQIKIALYELE